MLVEAQKSSRTTVERLLILLAPFVDDHHARLLAERRVGQDDVEPLARVAPQAVIGLNRRRRLVPLGADAVQKQVHGAEARDGVDDLNSAQGVELQVLLLGPVEVGVVLGDEVVGGQKKAAGPAGGVTDGLPGGRDASRPRSARMSGRGVKYWPAPPLVSCAFFSSRPS